MCALFGDSALIEHDYLFRLHKSCYAVGNENDGRPAEIFRKSMTDFAVRFRVDCGKRVVKDHNRRSLDDKSCNCRSLLLSAGERHASFADECVIAL